MSKYRGVTDYARPQLKGRKPFIPKPFVHKTRRVFNPAPVHGVFKTKLVSAPNTLASDNSQNGSTQTQLLNSGTTSLGSDSFVGVTNPRWKDQIRNGLDATTPASGTRINYENPWVTASRTTIDPSRGGTTGKSVVWYGYPTLPGLSISQPTASQISQCENRAKSKLLNRLDDVLSSVELGQDLGEYKETIHGLTKPLHSLRNLVLSYFDAVTKLKRSYKQGNPGLIKAVSDTYLEWTFGWHPLALDIADAYVGLRNRTQHPFRLMPIRAGAKYDYVGTMSTNTTPGLVDSFSYLKGVSNVLTRCTYVVTYSGMVKTNFVNGTIPAHEILQLDLPHFIPTVWDLIPYSFIVDYFTNVGDVIRSYSARTNSIAWCRKTTRTIFYAEKSLSVVSNTPDAFNAKTVGLLPSGTNSYLERVDFVRGSINPNTDLRPSFQFEMPNSEKPWVNIAAILAGRLKRLVPL